MANKHQPEVLTELIDKLATLPGLGKKTANRLALFFLKQSEEQVRSLAASLIKVKEEIKFCSICNNFTDINPCSRCSDPRCDVSVICVVETPADLMALESLGLFNGLYHVLGGALSPLSGVGPNDLKIQELWERIELSKNTPNEIKEVLLATGSSADGESTAVFLTNKLKEADLKITRLARGVPIGVDLEYVDRATLKQAFENKQNA